jgi:isopentenyl diphosphate isomerase/L-lactate dehydrogenase-like FMN-dependent dehydrogenase
MTQLRRPPLEGLINVLEFEDVAKLVLPPAVYSTIAGSDRTAFDRITMHPRLLVPMLDLDLSVDLFGDAHFTPILVGPVSDQRQYHSDAEVGTVRGASAAKASVVVSHRSSVPIADVAAHSKTPFWFSVYADGTAASRTQVEHAIGAGCKVICIASPSGRLDWKAVDHIRQGVTAPIVIKGVMTTADAQTAVAQGARGIVVSSFRSGGAFLSAGASAKAEAPPERLAPIEVLPAIVDAVDGKATVLVDGSFRRGSDIIKALALGAQGVLLARPIMWALAGYGAEGVRVMIEMLQNDLARHMGALGAENLKSLNRSFLRIHRR